MQKLRAESQTLTVVSDDADNTERVQICTNIDHEGQSGN